MTFILILLIPSSLLLLAFYVFYIYYKEDINDLTEEKLPEEKMEDAGKLFSMENFPKLHINNITGSIGNGDIKLYKIGNYTKSPIFHNLLRQTISKFKSNSTTYEGVVVTISSGNIFDNIYIFGSGLLFISMSFLLAITLYGVITSTIANACRYLYIFPIIIFGVFRTQTWNIQNNELTYNKFPSKKIEIQSISKLDIRISRNPFSVFFELAVITQERNLYFRDYKLKNILLIYDAIIKAKPSLEIKQQNNGYRDRDGHR